jgi:hypothetical protein
VGAYKLREGLLVQLSGDDATIRKTENVIKPSSISVLSAADDLRTEIETPSSELTEELLSSSQSLEQQSNQVGADTGSDSDHASTASETPTIVEASTSD